MSHFRAYVVSRDGHFMKSLVLDCADDRAAVESAKQLVDDHDIELWQRDRMIARFPRKQGFQSSELSGRPMTSYFGRATAGSRGLTASRDRRGLSWRMCDQTALRAGEIS